MELHQTNKFYWEMTQFNLNCIQARIEQAAYLIICRVHDVYAFLNDKNTETQFFLILKKPIN